MLEMGEFSNFIREMLELHYVEEQDRYLWDLFIHSYTDKTFEDFKAERIGKKEEKAMTDEEFEATVQHSMKILDGFGTSK